MAKIVLGNVGSGVSSNTVINNNNAAITTAFDNTLSRDGSSPNSMVADIDMNSIQSVINLRDPVTATEAAHKKYVDEVVTQGTVGVIATTIVSALTSLRVTTLINGDIVQLVAHTTAGDGGGGVFRAVTGAAAGTYTDNNGTIIVPTGGDGSAVWLREYSGAVNVKWFGAVGDGVTDDTAAIQAAITLGVNVFIPHGTYRTSSTLSISSSQVSIQGEGDLQSSPTIQALTDTFPILTATGTGTQSLLTITNLRLLNGTHGFVSSVTLSSGVGILDRTRFDNVTFANHTVCGLYADATQKMIIGTMVNCLFSYCISGIRHLGGNFSIWTILSCKFEGMNSNSIYLRNVNDANSCGSAVLIENCRFEATNGVSAGYYVCDFRSPQCMKFTNNYFEATSPDLIFLDGLYVNSINNEISNNFFGVVNGKIDTGQGHQATSIHDNYFLSGSINALSTASVIDVSIYNNQGIPASAITGFALGQIVNCDLPLSWTPAIKENGVNIYPNSAASGTYTVINGLVHLRGIFTYTGKTTPGNYAYLTGFPLPSTTTLYLMGTYITGDTTQYSVALSPAGTGAFHANNSPGAAGPLTGNELGPATGTLSINVTYSLK